MKDRAAASSATDHHLLPTYHLHDPNHHHDYRFNKKPRGGDEVWRDLPVRGAAEINLLANSLTTRLRKAARQRAATSAGTTTTTATTSSKLSRSAPPDDSERKHKSASKRDVADPQIKPSILKRTLSRTNSPYGDGRLPDVFADRHLSASTGRLDEVVLDLESGYNNQYLDRRSPTLAYVGGGSSRGHTSSGPVVWVKRAGIFQPADKYAPGRQSLHGDDQPFSRSLTVDYETVTLPSREDSPESGVTSIWSDGRSRRKGLKVSWKNPAAMNTDDEPEMINARQVSAENVAVLPPRLKSAGTVESDAAYSYSKPKFNPGKSRVPCIGLKWKVPTPKVGKPVLSGASSLSGDGSGSPSSSDSSSCHSSPASVQSLASSLLPPAHGAGPAPGKPSPQHARDPRHPWRALYPKDVHPVTTAMEREGTSVSKTKWQVPGRRKVPAYTFIEDLMESRCHQWNPAVQRARHPTRATLDAQSMQVRLAGEELMDSSNATTSTTTGLSDDTDHEQDYM